MTNKQSPTNPYDKRTGKITLPPEVEQEIRQLVLSGKKVEAVQRLVHLTGAGLKVSKDYADTFERKR